MSDGRRDAGATLVELLVAMTAFTMALAIMVTAVVAMARTSGKAQSAATTAFAVRTAFTRMDKQVRYADAINAPAVVGGAWWVEFRTPAVSADTPAVSTSSSARCTQWRFTTATGVLATRSWNEGAAPASTWSTLFTTSTDTATATANQAPFTLLPTTGSAPMAALTVAVTDARPGTQASASVLSTTFTARNSTAGSPTSVCDPATNRS